MPWFKVDDGLFTSRKVLGIPRPSRMQAMGLWCVAGAWASRELSDGFVPSYVVTELGATSRQADVLVAAGLWEQTEDGYQFHDWHDYQPTREDTETQRGRARERMRKLRSGSREQPANNARTSQNFAGSSPEVREPIVRDSRPDPTRPTVVAPLAKTKATPMPDDWTPSESNINYAKANGIDLPHQIGQFTSHHQAKGSTFKNWDQAFRTWLGNAKEWSRPTASEEIPWHQR